MITIDNSYTILPDKLRGRKPKFKLKKDGKTYIYKYGSLNNEIWAELIAEQLGKQADIEMAHYEVAEYKGTIGVLTDYFLDSTELIISSDNLKANIQNIYDENNININLKENTISNLVLAASMYDDRVDPKQLMLELMQRWCFYGLIMESDKNETNIGFIKGLKPLRLTPDYDNSSMAALDNNIQNFISSLMQGQNFYGITDGFKSNLKINKDDTEDFFIDFANFCQKYPSQAKYCITKLNNINVDEAFEKVEKINQVSIPWEVQFWVSKTITSRLEDMNNIYKQNHAKQLVK
ncbi:MAG: HipA domain-containing protein [Bacilli bacterium]|nr:HipA domain-containing protein [Bacilli bacterium]MBQ6840509.1 HipA domain-containing protein [Bacilli bacterium]